MCTNIYIYIYILKILYLIIIKKKKKKKNLNIDFLLIIKFLLQIFINKFLLSSLTLLYKLIAIFN